LEEFGVATYTPGLFTGVGFECRELGHADFGDMLEQNGKTLVKALAFIRNLAGGL
jgi:hypothetical protein